jgi:hypothetical protein
MGLQVVVLAEAPTQREAQALQILVVVAVAELRRTLPLIMLVVTAVQAMHELLTGHKEKTWNI